MKLDCLKRQKVNGRIFVLVFFQLTDTLAKAEMKRIKALSRPSSPHAKNSFTDSDTLDGVEQMPRKNRMSNMNHRFDSPSVDSGSMSMTQAQLDQKTFEIVKETIPKSLSCTKNKVDGAQELSQKCLRGARESKISLNRGDILLILEGIGPQGRV